MDIPQTYYQISKIAKGKPITVHITKNGVPLTDEELEKIVLTADADGLNMTSTPLQGKSAFNIKLNPDKKYREGFYTINCKAQCGNIQEAEANGRIELRKYPVWLRRVLIFIILAAIIALILAYLNAKILPRRITVQPGSTGFTVDSDAVGGAMLCNYTGKIKRAELWN